jgi:hypothetical protein
MTAVCNHAGTALLDRLFALVAALTRLIAGRAISHRGVPILAEEATVEPNYIPQLGIGKQPADVYTPPLLAILLESVPRLFLDGEERRIGSYRVGTRRSIDEPPGLRSGQETGALSAASLTGERLLQ